MPTIAEYRNEEAIPVVLANQLGLITYVNQKFVDVFGWSQQEIIGKPIAIIVPERFQDAHNLGLSRFITTEKPTLLNQPLALFAVTKYGKEMNAIHTIIAEKNTGEWEFGATIAPVAKDGA